MTTPMKTLHHGRRRAFLPLALFLFAGCLVVCLPVLRPAGIAAEPTFSIDFNNVRLENFLQTMSRILNQNFILAPGVSGTVTIYSAKPIPLKEAEAVFYSVLNLYGFTAIPDGNLTRIIPLADAKGRDIEIGAGRDPDKLAALGEKYITQIVPLSYSKPEAILPLLTPFLSKSGSLSADGKTNVLIISDNAVNIRKLLLVINQLDRAAPPGLETLHFYQLRNTNAQEVAQVLTQTAAQKTAARTSRPGETVIPISVVASPTTNSLLITASPEDYASLEGIIKELDRVPNQVLIEALVAEVSGDLAREFGIQWQYYDPQEGQYQPFGAVGGTFSSSPSAIVASGVPPTGLIAGVVKGTSTFNIGAIIKMYGKDTNFKILSTPQIVTTDNKEASIKVTDQIPYTKQITYGTTTTDQIPTQSFDYQEVGITLKLTPHISEDRNVRMEIEQEVTKLVSYLPSTGTGATVLAPTIAKRTAKSSVIVADHATLVLGGLTRNDSDETMEKVPFFGSIPLLGWLFRHKTKTTTQTSLYIFITPTVITTKEEARVLTEQKKSELDKADSKKTK